MGANEEEDHVAAVYCNTQQKNDMCVNHLLSIGYNDNLLIEKLKEKTKSVRSSLTLPHFQVLNQVIATASTHGERFHIMGGGHTNHYEVPFTSDLNSPFKASLLPSFCYLFQQL